MLLTSDVIDAYIPILVTSTERIAKISACETLKKTKQQLAVYRQAVLKTAFEGEYPKKPLKEISTAISGYAFSSKKYNTDGQYIVLKIGNINKMGELFVELSHGRSGGTWLEVGMELRQAATGSLLKISRKF